MDLQFAVVGTPVPQGSMKHIGNGKLIPNNDKKLKDWRKLVAQSAMEQIDIRSYPDALRVTAFFVFEKPKSVKRDHPTVPPDLDKLCRAVGDAISIDANIINDDSQIVEWSAKKEYGDVAGAFITLEKI